MYHTHDHHTLSFFLRPRLTLSMCALFLVFLLSACGSGGTSAGTTSASSIASTSTPALQATSAPTVHMKMYAGTGFTISYPDGWTTEKVSPTAASVIFVNPIRTIEFIVTVAHNPNANSATSVTLDPLVQSMQAKPHYQKVALASTTIVGGETWDQVGAIGDLLYSGQPLSIKVIAMALNRPAHEAGTKMYRIQFSAPAKDVDQADSSTFQPMLQSFKFT